MKKKEEGKENTRKKERNDLMTKAELKEELQLQLLE